MEHFVRVVFDRQVNLSEALNESVFPGNQLLETEQGGSVLHIPLPRSLTDEESDEFADRLAKYMFESGYDNFDIETSLPFDVVEDIIEFMRNDPHFYRKQYFPAIAKMADIHRAGKKFDKSVLGSMIDSGMNSYCKKFNLGDKPADVFTMEDRQSILNKITSEELENIKKGDY